MSKTVSRTNDCSEGRLIILNSFIIFFVFTTVIFSKNKRHPYCNYYSLDKRRNSVTQIMIDRRRFNGAADRDYLSSVFKKKHR